MTNQVTRLLVAILLTVGGAVPAAHAQCCATACLDADGAGAEDDAVRCQTIATERLEALPGGDVALGGCQELEGVACAGGRVDVFPPVGCVCLGDTCEGGANPLDSAACSERAAGACLDAGIADVTLDAAACGGDADSSS